MQKGVNVSKMDKININEFDDINSFLKSIKQEMKGCTEIEIEKLKQITKGKCLPKDYIDFMMMAGNGIKFWRGSDYTVNKIRLLKEWAIKLLEENDFSENLTENDFVFFMHQGYIFAFFKLDDRNHSTYSLYAPGAATSDVHINASRVVPVGHENAPQTISERWDYAVGVE